MTAGLERLQYLRLKRDNASSMLITFVNLSCSPFNQTSPLRCQLSHKEHSVLSFWCVTNIARALFVYCFEMPIERAALNRLSWVQHERSKTEQTIPIGKEGKLYLLIKKHPKVWVVNSLLFRSSSYNKHRNFHIHNRFFQLKQSAQQVEGKQREYMKDKQFQIKKANRKLTSSSVLIFQPIEKCLSVCLSVVTNFLPSL